jgi:phosphonate transport system ATP-binding protein
MERLAGMRVELAGLAARHPAAAATAPPALQPLTLAIAPGEQLAVIGPSGAGKTTLLHALACALKPASGTLRLDGTDPWSLSVRELQKLRGRLFLAPQTPPLPPRQRVITAVLAARLPAQSLWASLRSLLYPTDIGAAHAALSRFDLAPKLWERVDRLSGGERQRVGLARGLLAPASLWLVDEPLSALDPTRARQAVDTLIQVAAERGATLVTTLHQVDVATRFPRVVGLRDGQLAFDLPGAQVTRERLAQLYAQHEHELAGAAPIDAAPPAAPPTPVVTMVCR